MWRSVVVIGCIVMTGCGPGERAAPDAPPMPPSGPTGSLRAGYHLAGLTTVPARQRIDLASAPDGILVAGRYLQAGALRSFPARWDGAQWRAMPSGPQLLAVTPDGTIYGAEDGDLCLECNASRIRRLQGQTWEVVPGLDGVFRAIASTSFGLTVTGDLIREGTAFASVAVLDDTQWRTLGLATGTPGTGAVVRAVAERNGVLCVGGSFAGIDGVAASNVACMSSFVWTQAGDGLAGEVHTLAFASDGRLVAGGRFATTGGANLAVLDGGAWSALGGGVDGAEATVEAIAIDGAAIVVGGSFTSPAASLARLEGGVWTAPPMPLGALGPTVVTDLAVRPEGVYVAGRFDLAGNAPVANIARWDAAGLAPLLAPGDVPLGITGEVRALIAHPSGGTIAAGAFAAAGTVPARNAARLVDGAWQPLGDPAPIEVLVRRDGGDILAGDEAGALLQLSGDTWIPLGAPLGGAIRAIAELDGAIVVAGDFTSTGRHVARWNGTAFEPMSDGLEAPVFALGRHAGRLCAGIDLGGDLELDELDASRPLWCWTGTTWIADTTLRGPTVFAIATLPDESTVLTGVLWNGDQAFFIARAHGTSWQEVRPLGSVSQLETTLASGHGGVYIATYDTITWWDGGDTGLVPIANGSQARALLPTADGLFLGGRGVWTDLEPANPTAPISCAIAEWRLHQ